ncbi:MAG: gamma-glutamyltransferase [bacterium]|nr:gamma-glutamyltransferase [bacterium]
MNSELRNMIFPVFCWLFVVALMPSASVAVDSPAVGESCMVVSAHPIATNLGLSVLREGGNAVDATVAVSLALAGCEPYSSGLGGGGFFVWFDPSAEQVKTLDARETAPMTAHRDMYLIDGQPDSYLSRSGPLASGVPGLVAGLWELHQKGGRLPWKDLVLSAAREIRQIPVSPMLQTRIEWKKEHFNEAARLVFLPGGKIPDLGSSLVQEHLFQTMKLIADHGPNAFYSGPVAEAIVEVSTGNNQSGISLKDLAAYKPRWRDPVHGQYHELDVYSMAPPSSGGVHLVQMLNILEPFDLSGAGFNSSKSLHWLTEAMKFAYADRSLYLGDSDFVLVPVQRLVAKTHADSLRNHIQSDRAFPEESIIGAPLVHTESNETTHLSIIDSQGMAIAATLTINLTFGSCRMAPGTGVLMNNEMDDFAAAPGTPNAFGLVGAEANSIAPGKRPLSSMTPTIVTESGKVRIVTGAPGGSKIISTTLQTIVNVVDHEMNALQAVTAPRIHHQWFPRKLYFEEYGISPGVQNVLKGMGHILQSRGPICNAQIIVVEPETGHIEGASDPRGMGMAAGF